MVIKSVKKAVENLKINTNYSMYSSHMDEIYDCGGTYEIICMAFKFGYLQGSKAEKCRKAVS